MKLLGRLLNFIDSLDTTPFMRGYITAVLYNAVNKDIILKDFYIRDNSEDFSFDMKVVDIPQFMKRKKGDFN